MCQLDTHLGERRDWLEGLGLGHYNLMSITTELKKLHLTGKEVHTGTEENYYSILDYDCYGQGRTQYPDYLPHPSFVKLKDYS